MCLYLSPSKIPSGPSTERILFERNKICFEIRSDLAWLIFTAAAVYFKAVSSWATAAEEEVTSDAKKERCAKVSGEVVYTVVDRLNEHSAGRWDPPAWQPAEGYAKCVKCHGPNNALHPKTPMNEQQGHMDCLMCHVDDHGR